MKKDPSFSVALINLFIGLVKGHRTLRPTSDHFRSLGYQLFQIEPKFQSTAGNVNPEAIAFSSMTDHSLLVEWTEAECTQKKKDQIIRYTKVSRDDLVNKAGVPSNGASANSLWLIVRPYAAKDYSAFVLRRNKNGILLSYFESVESGFELVYVVGNLLDTCLSTGVCCRIPIKRIPLGYVPVTIECTKPKDYIEPVTQQLASFFVKKKLEFTSEDICQEIFGAWNSFALKKRKEVRGIVTQVLKEIERDSRCAEWFSRITDSPLRWKVSIPAGRSERVFYSALERYVGGAGSLPTQLRLFDD